MQNVVYLPFLGWRRKELHFRESHHSNVEQLYVGVRVGGYTPSDTGIDRIDRARSTQGYVEKIERANNTAC